MRCRCLNHWPLAYNFISKKTIIDPIKHLRKKSKLYSESGTDAGFED